MQSRLISLTLLTSFIFLHFVVARPGNFPLTVAPFSIIFFLSACYRIGAAASDQRIAIGLITILCTPLFAAFQISSGDADFVQFLRTYALWVTSATTIFVATSLPIKRAIDVTTPATVALAVITLVVAFQSVSSSSGNTSYFNLFGDHQYFGEIDLQNLAVGDRLRPPGLYLEPSFCAYVVLNLCAVNFLQGQHIKLSLGLTALSVLFIQSLTGLLAFAAVLLVVLITSKSTNIRQTAFFSLAAAIFLGGLYFIYGEYIVDRINQVDSTGSSTNYRITALLPVLQDVILTRPFGYALGRVREVIPLYHIQHGNGFGESIDNGLYLLIFYFGWIGLAFNIYFGATLFKALIKKNQSLSMTLTVLLFGFFFNGGIMLPEFALISSVLIYCYRIQQWKPKIKSPLSQ